MEKLAIMNNDIVLRSIHRLNQTVGSFIWSLKTRDSMGQRVHILNELSN